MAPRATAKNTEVTTEVAKKEPTLADLAERSASERFTDTQLLQIGQSENAWEAALALVQEQYGDVVDVSKELGNGFFLLSKSDKKKLVGKPFVILHFSVNPGDFGEYFTSMACVGADGAKFIVNDGSTGIHQELTEFALRTGRQGGLMCKNGLRVSDYPTCSNCERPRPEKAEICRNCGDESETRHRGETFYIDTTPSPS